MLSLHIHNSCFYLKEKHIEKGHIIEGTCPDVILHFFDCSYKGLLSLKNCPKIVYGTFYGAGNSFTSLKYISLIKGAIDLQNNNLTSLEHLQTYIDGNLDVNYNKLTNLEFCPDVTGNISCYNNELTSLKGISKNIKEIFCISNPLNNLEHCPSGCDIYANDIFFIESEFIEKGYTDYWPDLFKYCRSNDISVLSIKQWPENFLESLQGEDNEYVLSCKGIGKFDL